MQLIWIVIIILSLWSVSLTFLLWRLFSHYNILMKGSNNRSLQELLEHIVKDMDIAKKDIAFLQKQCDTIEKEGRLHIQKIGLLRFNPFSDTGGDQSFILAFVDSNDTGVIISGLHSRAGTRWYAKKIHEGKGIDYDLSDEEKKALKETKQSTSKQ